MISINRLLAFLVALVIVAAVGRVWTLAHYYRTVDLQVTASGKPSDLRERLGLDQNRRVTRLVAVPDKTRPASWKLAWIAVDGDASAAIRGTAILSDDSAELLAVDITSLLPDSLGKANATLTPSWLDKLRIANVAAPPSQPLGQSKIDIGIWDAEVPVYVTAGADGAPGIAGHDDDGSGVIDDLGELGATGSDDFVVAPGQPGYEAAISGRTLSRLISRGAIVAATPDQPLELTPATEVWLDFDRGDSARHRQIMLRLR